MRTLLIALVGLLVVVPGVASAADIVINNGLAPPNSENVIDDGTYSDDYVYVRSVGCPPGWPAVGGLDSCPSPGAPTEVELTDGGTVLLLFALDSCAITMNGGTVDSDVRSFGSSSITISGGTPSHALYAFDSSTITVVGSNFEVDSVPVPDGDLVAYGGTLTGMLASGDALDSIFRQGGGAWTGTITLVPVPEPGELLLFVSGGVGLLGLARLRRRL
jgi:hypothetical protein